MVSDEPRDDRCAASVTSRVGLVVEVDELDETFSDDGRLVEVVLQRGAVTAHKEPEYGEVVSYLRNGFHVSMLRLRPSDGSQDGDEVTIEDSDEQESKCTIEINDVGYDEVTHRTTEHDGFCERFKMDDRERCYVHGGSNPGAPEGNVRAMTHGLRAKRSNFYKNLEETDKAFVEQMAHSWIDNAPFGKDNKAKVNEVYRIAVDQLRLWHAQDEFDDGIVYEQVVDTKPDGEEIMENVENPANLPYSRLDRDMFKKLKELGCLDDPDSQQAEATESLAAKFENL